MRPPPAATITSKPITRKTIITRAIAAQAGPGQTPEEIKTNLMAKFSRCSEHPFMKKIFVAVYQYKLQKKAS